MKRTLIPIAAACVIALLSTTEWGSLYATLRSFGREKMVAQIMLSGFAMPQVTVETGAKMQEDAAEKIIRVTIREKTEPKTALALSVPSSWELQEVSGIHIRDVATNDAAGMARRYTLDAAAEKTFPLVFLFRTRDALNTVTFSHDSPSVALLDLRRTVLSDASSSRTVQLVRKTRTVEL